MKKFIVKLFLFIMPFLLCFTCIEYALRNIESNYKEKRDRLIEQSNSIEILIVGNSHALNGINPKYLKRKAFNLAFGSQTLLYDKALIQKYIPILPKLKYVIISIDYPSFYWGIVEERDFFYKYYYDINLRHHSFIKENISFFFNVYTPKPSLKLLSHNPKISLQNGWIGFDTIKDDALTDAKGKSKINQFDSIITNSKESAHIYSELEKLISSLKEKNIVPILVTAPCSQYYINYLDRKKLSENLNRIHDLQHTYNLSYLNLLEDPLFKREDFYNVDHLNKYGAEKFTLKIDSLINTIEHSKP